MPGWISIVEFLARIILLGLFFMSIWCLKMILERKKFFNIMKITENRDILINIFTSKNKQDLNKWIDENKDHPYSSIFNDSLKNLNNQNFERSYANLVQIKKMAFEKDLSTLATFGSASPFIGLLGTILGIIVSFGYLSQGKYDTNMVMFSLAEALILTAVGLVVAIPSVISFNFFSKKLKQTLIDLELYKNFLLEWKD